MLGEVGASAREPASPRHHASVKNLLEHAVSRDIEELPDRRPELLEAVAGRPRPQRLVIRKAPACATLAKIDERSEPR